MFSTTISVFCSKAGLEQKPNGFMWAGMENGYSHLR